MKETQKQTLSGGWFRNILVICLILGGVFAVTMFLLVTFLGDGASFTLAPVSLLSGAVFGATVFAVIVIPLKLAGRMTFTNRRARRKLNEFEREQGILYDAKFAGLILYGKRHGRSICETNIYFDGDNLHLCFFHSGKVIRLDFPKGSLKDAFLRDELLLVNSYWNGSAIISIQHPENNLPLVRDRLCAMGFGVDPANAVKPAPDAKKAKDGDTEE